jgi:hypothetical protein
MIGRDRVLPRVADHADTERKDQARTLLPTPPRHVLGAPDVHLVGQIGLGRTVVDAADSR